jgi:hypothetical protein
MLEPTTRLPPTALQRWILESQRQLLARKGAPRPTALPALSGGAFFVKD